jgi:hypothetical protein
MAVAVTQVFAGNGTDRSTTNYDAIHERVQAHVDDNGPPAGFMAHAAGFGDDGRFQIVELWESREQFDRFTQETVMPIVLEVTGGAPGPQPQTSFVDLHQVVVAPRTS